jgi:hypothetical protein
MVTIESPARKLRNSGHFYGLHQLPDGSIPPRVTLDGNEGAQIAASPRPIAAVKKLPLRQWAKEAG